MYNQGGRNSYNGRSRNQVEEPNFPNIDQALSEKFTNPADIYLPNGLADQYATKFKERRVLNHQLRKILDEVKSALLKVEKGNFESAKKQMFIIVAMSAYNSGRNKDLKILYEFISKTINEKSITCNEDIKVFDQLFTSIVAYHKTK